MNWLQRHINWTIVIVWLGGGIVMGLVAQTDTLGVLLVVCLLWYITMLVVSIWGVMQKRRSAWNLLWAFFLGGIGLIIILCLKNKTPHVSLEGL